MGNFAFSPVGPSGRGGWGAFVVSASVDTYLTLPSPTMSDDANPVTVTRLAITSTDGLSLEAEVHRPKSATSLAVVAHPHPLYGGSMHNPVVQALMDGFVAGGAAALRFNFRGVGGSDGEHENGVGERLDLAGALAYLCGEFPTFGVTIAGYSFGSVVALSTDHERATGWCAVAPPLQLAGDPDALPGLSGRAPSTVLVGRHDQYVDIDSWTTMAANRPHLSLEVLEHADHFFAVGLSRIRQAAQAHAEEARDAQ